MLIKSCLFVLMKWGGKMHFVGSLDLTRNQVRFVVVVRLCLEGRFVLINGEIPCCLSANPGYLKDVVEDVAVPHGAPGMGHLPANLHKNRASWMASRITSPTAELALEIFWACVASGSRCPAGDHRTFKSCFTGSSEWS